MVSWLRGAGGGGAHDSGMVVSVRGVVEGDVPLLEAFDPLVLRGDVSRSRAIRRWAARNGVRVAELDGQVVGYCVIDESFFEQSFVVLVVVAEDCRRRGIGGHLMRDAEQYRRTPKLFTSTNLSNHAMQGLLMKLGWQSVGIVYGLDEEDPELFFMAPRVSG